MASQVSVIDAVTHATGRSMFWKRKSESYIESERCDAELEYDEGRRLRLQGMYESAQESYQACIARLEALDEDDASRLMLRMPIEPSSFT